MAAIAETPYFERPCAAAGLTSYRYFGDYGYIMIGAKNHHDALREAARSVSGHSAELSRLQVWDVLLGEYTNTAA